MGIKKTKICSQCGDKHALYYSNKDKRARADKNHDLCQRCFRALQSKLNQQFYKNVNHEREIK
jgi:hypothetical protein